MYTAVDTETTGLAAPRALAVALARLAPDGAVQEEFYSLVKPVPGTRIEPGAAAIHGLTLERCADEGRTGAEIGEILHAFAVKSRILLAYNVDYDLAVLQNLIADHHLAPLPPMAHFCVMKTMTDVCKLPGKWGKYKWPRLEEAYAHAFQRTLADAHNARTDLRATCDIFAWWLSQIRAPAPAPTQIQLAIA